MTTDFHQSPDWLAEATAHKYCLVDPTLIFWSDVSNMGTALAYSVAFVFVASIFFTASVRGGWPTLFKVLYWLGVGFVMSCGVSHFLDVVVTHRASYLLNVIVTYEMVLTASVSMAFIIVALAASRRWEVSISVTPRRGRV